MQTTAQRARSHSARAAACTRRAEKWARDAASFYQTSRGWARQAAQLTQTPRMWFEDYTPAQLESTAATWKHVGDTFLRMSFHETDRAAHYRAMAARARATATQEI